MTWIDCNERLPDDQVVVTVHSPRSPIQVWPGYVDDGVWYWFDGFTVPEPVTHWQPLPDPPDDGQ